jgi:hypothetical protein
MPAFSDPDLDASLACERRRGTSGRLPEAA